MTSYRSKETIQKPVVYIAGVPNSENETLLLEAIEAQVDLNPFVRMYYAPGLYSTFQGLWGSETWRKNAMDQRRNEIQQSDVVIFHEEFMNTEALFDVGYAHALNKKIILVAKHDSISPIHATFYDRVETIELVADYNLLKI